MSALPLGRLRASLPRGLAATSNLATSESIAKIWTITALLAVSGVLLLLRGNQDRVPPHQPLDALPIMLGSWQGEDQTIPGNVLEVLGKGEFLSRVYHEASPAPPVGLFLGYFPTQRSGQSIHSPQNCLPGAGWSFDRSGTTGFTAGGRHYEVGDYLISNGQSRDEVLYWYRAQGDDIAGDYRAKADMLFNAMVRDRTDAALIRIMTPVVPGETVTAARARVVAFAQNLVPRLGPFIPN